VLLVWLPLKCCYGSAAATCQDVKDDFALYVSIIVLTYISIFLPLLALKSQAFGGVEMNI
jgi:hypothetical protein